MSSHKLRLGTRGSQLALAQSGTVARALEAEHPGLEVQLVAISTRGDRTPGDLAPLGGKGLFTAELEAGLLDGSLDLAVHSLKDLPMQSHPQLSIAAFPQRVDPRDVLIAESPALDTLPAGATVLTGALRRRAQIARHRPDLALESLRGNVGTRIEKWRQRTGSALVLAAAGLARLGIETSEALPIHPIAAKVVIPAPGQGILAVQVRSGSDAETLCRSLDHAPTAEAARAERQVVSAFGGSCALPLAAWARGNGGGMRVSAFLGTADGRRFVEADAAAPSGDEAAAACIALLEERGAGDVLAAIGS